jgi:hypothetical protein
MYMLELVNPLRETTDPFKMIDPPLAKMSRAFSTVNNTPLTLTLNKLS